MNRLTRLSALSAMVAGSALLIGAAAHASSHREAPAITATPKVDATDFYMFNSYESGRSGMVTIVADYLPLQDAYGGPNFFTLDPNAVYEIKIDNNGDSVEDLTFQFQFKTTRKNITLDVGGTQVAVPVINVGPIASSPPTRRKSPPARSTWTKAAMRRLRSRSRRMSARSRSLR